MTNIEKRIIQILTEKEPLNIEDLTNKIKTVAFKQDKINLDKNRIHNSIKSQIKKNIVIIDDEDMLYINNPQNMNKIFKKNGITIKHYPTGKEMTFGSPGIIIGESELILGNIDNIKAKPDNYFFVLDVDLPVRLEINEQLKEPYDVKLSNKTYSLFHKIKKRGEEIFSCLDTVYIPYFSSLQITGNVDNDFFNNSKVDLVKNILQKINIIINNPIISKIIEGKYNLPFQYFFIQKIDINKDKRDLIALALNFLTTEIKILGKTIDNEYPKEELRKLLNSEKIVLQNKIENRIDIYNSIEDFSSKIFNLTHDFSYYIRQTPEVFGNMKEEDLRDIYLFCTKIGTEYNCEAECFNYDGKADFKIKSSNSYEYIIGEFKWWNGNNSIEELCMQGLEKHVTGQEKDIYLILLNNKNKDINGPKEKSLEYIRNRKEVISECCKCSLPEGSKENFYKFEAKIRGNNVNVFFVVIDLFYQRI